MSLSRKNKEKWLIPPDIGMIEKFIKDLGVTAPRFELFFGIPNGTIRGIRHGNRSLPARYWHIIYDRVEPKFGYGFLESEKRPIKINRPLNINIVTKTVTKEHFIPELKGRLGDLAQ